MLSSLSGAANSRDSVRAIDEDWRDRRVNPTESGNPPTSKRPRQLALHALANRKSKRSRFITLSQTCTKSFTNFSWASALP